MICNNNNFEKVLKFISKKISNQEVPQKVYSVQVFILTQLKNFLTKLFFFLSSINDQRSTRCVERTIGSIKSFVPTYTKEKSHGNLEKKLKVLGALRFAPNASMKMSPFETHHGATSPKNRRFQI